MPKTGGRQKGTPNKATPEFRERLERLGCRPEEFLAMTVNGTLPCIYCKPGARRDGDDECPACKGTGQEKIKVGDRITAAIRLLDSTDPRLAAKTVDKTVRRFVVARMNALSAEDRAEIERKAQEDEGE